MKNLLYIFLLLISACTPHYPHHYDNVAPQLALKGVGEVVVVTQDNRPELVSKELKPWEVGRVESIDGRMWPINTASGRSFAEDVSAAACQGLARSGFDCFPLAGDTDRNILTAQLQDLRASRNPARFVLLTVKRWNVRVSLSPSLSYELALTVLNREGTAQAAVSVNGENSLGMLQDLNPAKTAGRAAPQALKEVLEMLFNHEDVSKSLEGQAQRLRGEWRSTGLR